MRSLIEAFLSIPVGGRAAIVAGVLVLLWRIFGRLILKLISMLSWLLKKIFFGIYIILEIPVSILHNKFGSVFGVIDQGLTTATEKVCNCMDKLFGKMNKPPTTYIRQVFVVYLVISAYLLIPMFANLTEKPFTFWQKSYVRKEAAVVKWMDDKGWFEK